MRTNNIIRSNIIYKYLYIGSGISYDKNSLSGIARYTKSEQYIFTVKLPINPRHEVETITKAGDSKIIKMDNAYLCYNFDPKDIKYIPLIAAALNSLMKMLGENIKCKYSNYQFYLTGLNIF